MTLAAEPDILTPIQRQVPKSHVLVRLVAGVVGLVVLACAATVTLGTVAIALIGMAVVGGVQRKRGRALTRTGHWVTACSVMAIVLLAIGGTLLAAVPKDALNAARRSMDSTNTASAKQQPPAWVEKLYPQYRQATANAKPPSPTMVWISMLFGVGIVVSFFSALVGTLGWGAGMLLGLAATGRWPGVRGESLEDLVAAAPAAIQLA